MKMNICQKLAYFAFACCASTWAISADMLLRDARYLYNADINSSKRLIGDDCDIFQLLLDVESGYADVRLAQADTEVKLDATYTDYRDRILDEHAMFSYALYQKDRPYKAFTFKDSITSPELPTGKGTYFAYCFSTTPWARVKYVDLDNNDIQWKVVEPVYTDSFRRTHFDLINRIREGLGLGVLSQSAILDEVAQSNIAYLRMWEGKHITSGFEVVPPETIGNAGFSGATEQDRCVHYNYNGICAPAVLSVTSNDPLFYRGSPYQALSVLSQDNRDIGIGVVDGYGGFMGGTKFFEYQLGRSSNAPPQNQAPGFTMATFLWGAFHLHVNKDEPLEIEKFDVFNSAGEPIPGRLVTYENDLERLVPINAAMFIPNSSLNCGSAYYSIVVGKRGGTHFQKSWADDACSFDSDNRRVKKNLISEIESISLDIDLSMLQGLAHYQLVPSENNYLNLDIGDLEIISVTNGYKNISHSIHQNGSSFHNLLAIDVGPETHIFIKYQYKPHNNFEGWGASGFTYTWPDKCSNLYPCLEKIGKGVAFKLNLSAIPEGKQAIYPRQLAIAPYYQPAWAIGDYRWMDLGVTPLGTQIYAIHFAGREELARSGTDGLKDIFAWYESKLGFYPYGNEAGSVEVDWPGATSGAIEHHPYWHVERGSYTDLLTHAHEAAHGWFGNGVRLSCWSEFVLSEGVASYLAAAAIGAIKGEEAEADVWKKYVNEIPYSSTSQCVKKIWTTCNSGGSQSLKNYDNALTYYVGAYFFKAIESKVGRPALLAALRDFVEVYRYQAGTMTELLNTIKLKTGYDPTNEVGEYSNWRVPCSYLTG